MGDRAVELCRLVDIARGPKGVGRMPNRPTRGRQNSNRAPMEAVNGRPTAGPKPGPYSETGCMNALADVARLS